MSALSTPRARVVLIAVLACIAVLAAGWFLAISPQREKVAAVKADAAAAESSNASLRAQVANLQEIQRKLPQQRAELNKTMSKVPATPNLPDLVRSLNEAAEASNVTLIGIAPKQPAALPAAAGVSGIDVELKAKGDYVSLEQYQLALEGLTRAFLVNGIQIAPNTGSSTASSGTTPGATGDLVATISGRVLISSNGVPAGAGTTS